MSECVRMDSTKFVSEEMNGKQSKVIYHEGGTRETNRTLLAAQPPRGRAEDRDPQDQSAGHRHGQVDVAAAPRGEREQQQLQLRLCSWCKEEGIR